MTIDCQYTLYFLHNIYIYIETYYQCIYIYIYIRVEVFRSFLYIII